jgi:hypothetical protein
MISIVTDVHAHFYGLQSVLERIQMLEKTRYDGRRSLRVCLGDMLDAGPLPKETLDLLTSEFDVFLRGNHEDYVFGYVKNQQDPKFLDPLWRMVPWAANTLGFASVLEFERKCLFAASSRDGFVKFFHASPESNASSPSFFPKAQLENEIVLSQVASLIVVGHTHYFGSHISGQNHWINAGSVGYPFLTKDSNNSYASFVTLHFDQETNSENASQVLTEKRNVEVKFHAVPYSRNEYLKACLQKGFYEQCLPFSVPIMCQSLFNCDITFPFFKRAKSMKIDQLNMPQFLVNEMSRLGLSAQLESLFEELGKVVNVEKDMLASLGTRGI